MAHHPGPREARPECRLRAGHPGDASADVENLLRLHHGRQTQQHAVYRRDIGVTNDLIRRTWEHREGMVSGFTKKHGVKLLVYYETFEDVQRAIHRETQRKKYKREWKMNLIQQHNVEWKDLSATL
jgi:putative endonuclease